MLEIVFWYFLISITAALAAFVGVRAWDYRPARIFVVTCMMLLAVRMFADLRDSAVAPPAAVIPAVLSLASIALLELLLLLLFAAIFVPVWYEGRRPIMWIALPYLLASVLLIVDGIMGTGLVLSGIRATDNGFRMELARPGGPIMLSLFVISWIPHLIVLGVAFFQQRLARKSIALLILALVAAQISGSIGSGGILQSLPIIIALGYTVLRTRLLLPTRAGLAIAVQAMDDAVIVRDMRDAITFINPAAERLGLHAPETLAVVSAATVPDERVQVATHTLTVRQQSLVAPSGAQLGTLLLARDVTALEQREQQLKAEQARLTATIARLTEAQQERAALTQTMQQLTMPVIPVLPGVLVIPLVGAFDGLRINQLSETMLKRIEQTRAELVLVDITGVPLLDTAGANGLLQAIHAAALLGARCVLVGMHPEIAQALVGLGLALDELKTAATLEQALQQVIAQRSNRFRPARNPASSP